MAALACDRPGRAEGPGATGTAGAAASNAPAAPGPTSGSWHTLGNWSGRGHIQTESFDVTTGALRLTWAARPATAPKKPGQGPDRLRVVLHSAISGRALQTVVDHAGAGAGTAFFEDEPRVSYLVVEADGVEWSLELEEAAAR